MYCNFRRNNGCNKCTNFVKSIDINGTDTELTVAIPAQSLCECSTICICFAQPIPTEAKENSKLNILVGEDSYPAITPCGNLVYGDQVKSGKMYCFKFAVDTLVFAYCGGERLCRTKHKFSCIPISTAPKRAKTKPKKTEVKDD